MGAHTLLEMGKRSDLCMHVHHPSNGDNARELSYFFKKKKCTIVMKVIGWREILFYPLSPHRKLRGVVFK